MIATANSSTPVEAAIAAAVDELAFYVERDRKNLADRRRVGRVCREDRLMLGARLNERRAAMSNQAFGRVLRRLGLNRHTAHHAMRLAAEFTTDGKLDLAKLAEARERGRGILRASAKGARAYAAEPDSLTVEDLGRIMRARTKPGVVGAHQQRDSGSERAGGSAAGVRGVVDVHQQRDSGSERAGGSIGNVREPREGRGEVGRGQSPPVPAPPPSRGSRADHHEVGRGAGRGEGRGAGRGVGRGVGRGGASGAQMNIDFDSAAARAFGRVDRVRQRIALGSITGDRLGEGLELLERLDTWALSLLHAGAA